MYYFLFLQSHSHTQTQMIYLCVLSDIRNMIRIWLNLNNAHLGDELRQFSNGMGPRAGFRRQFITKGSSSSVNYTWKLLHSLHLPRHPS